MHAIVQNIIDPTYNVSIASDLVTKNKAFWLNFEYRELKFHSHAGLWAQCGGIWM